MKIFDPYPDLRTDDNEAVLCHEVGHAIAWFTFCGVVGSVIVSREPGEDGIEADILLLPRDGKKATKGSPDYAVPYVSMLIAGDVAYRKKLGMAEGKLSLRGFTRDSRFETLEEVFCVLERQNRKSDDVYKFILKALQVDPSDPLKWLSKRLSEAENIVNESWSAIISTANRLKVTLPTHKPKRWTPGTDLITWFMKEGIKPGQAPPLEIVHWEDPTYYKVSTRRLCRRILRKHGVIHVEKRK